jgi:hypothetical protein
MALFEKIPEEASGPKKPYKLDPQTCFKLWWELGSLQRATYYLQSMGYVNPATARPFSMGGVRAAAFAWMFEHPDEAYQSVLEAGSHMTRHEFNQVLIWRKRTRTASTSGMHLWLKKHDLLDPDGSKGYKAIYEGKFRRIHIGGIANLPTFSEQVHPLSDPAGGGSAPSGAAQPSANAD